MNNVDLNQKQKPLQIRKNIFGNCFSCVLSANMEEMIDRTAERTEG